MPLGRGRAAASLALWSACSFPSTPRWAGVHLMVTADDRSSKTDDSYSYLLAESGGILVALAIAAVESVNRV